MSIDLLIGAVIILGIIAKALHSAPLAVLLLVDCAPSLVAITPSILAMFLAKGANPTMIGVLHMVAALVDIGSYYLVILPMISTKHKELMLFRRKMLQRTPEDVDGLVASSWSQFKHQLNPVRWICLFHKWVERNFNDEMNDLREELEEEQ